MITRQMFTETSNEACTGVFLLSANEVCEGYVFTGVCLSTGGGSAPLHAGIHPPGRHHPGQTPPQPDTPPPGQTPPCPVHAGIQSTSGRYASYWNAILSHGIFVFFHQMTLEL